MQIMIEIPEKLACEGFERSFTEEEKNILIKAIGNGTPLPNGRKFEGIVVEYPPAELCIYPEYKGRPYFTIRYEENGEHIIGFGTYNPQVLTRYLQEYFISDIQPKIGHWIYDKNIENWRCSECGETPKTLGYCGTVDFMTEHFKYCNHCGIRMVEPQESEKINCKITKCENCQNHNYCDYEPQEGGDQK